MNLITKIVCISFLTPLYVFSTDASITLFLYKYPYFKVDDQTKFDPEKYSKKLKQPSFLYRNMTNRPSRYQRSVPDVMCMYDGHVALSDHNGQIMFPRQQISPDIYILVAKGIKPAYIVAPSTIYNWMVDKTQAAQNYKVTFKQDNELELYYFDVQKTDLPKGNNIPLNTIIMVTDPEHVYIPTGATVTQFGANLNLPPIYIRREFCFLHNSFYNLAIKQYFDQDEHNYQLEGQTVSDITQ